MVKNQIKGMGGWLLVFTLTVTVRPLINVLGVIGAASLMIQVPGSALVMSAYSLFTLIIALYGAWVAYTLWVLKPNALITVRNYFGVLIAYSLIVALLRFLPHGVSGEVAEFLKDTGSQALRNVVYIAIWTTYLRRSRRIINTFYSSTEPAQNKTYQEIGAQ